MQLPEASTALENAKPALSGELTHCHLGNWVALPYVSGGITYQFDYIASTKTIEIQAVEPRIKSLTDNPGNISFRATWVQMQLHSPESKPKAQILGSNFLYNWKEARSNC
jgi:hypothetical protein